MSRRIGFHGPVVTARLGPPLRRYASSLGRRRRIRAALAALPAILADANGGLQRTRILNAEVTRADARATGLVLLWLKTDGGSVLLRIAESHESRPALERHRSALVEIASDGRLRSWRPAVPELVASGHVERSYLIETLAPGEPALDLIRKQKMPWERVLVAAAEAAAGLHAATAVRRTITGDLLDSWIRIPLMQVTDAIDLHEPSLQNRMSGVQSALESLVGSRNVRLCRVHGDYWLGNLLFVPQKLQVSSVVDWELTVNEGIAAHDVLHLLLYARRLRFGRDLGQIVAAMLERATWQDAERAILASDEYDWAGSSEAAVLVLYWLGHVAGNLGQHPAYARNRGWVRRNISEVLRCF